MADQTFPGPHCQRFGITGEDLHHGKLDMQNQTAITNGAVLEIHSYLEKCGKSSNDLYNLLVQIEPKFRLSSAKYLRNKVSRLVDQKKKLSSKKKVQGFKSIQDLMNSEFKPPDGKQESAGKCDFPNDNALNENKSKSNTTFQTIKTNNNSNHRLIDQSCQTCFESDSDYESDVKHTNFIKYKHDRLKKNMEKLEKKIEEQKNTFSEMTNRVGHYSIRNINKRDETAKKNLHALRDCQRLAKKQERQIKDLLTELSNTSDEVAKLKKQTTSLSSECSTLKDRSEMLEKRLEDEKSKKQSAQKMNSYFRRETDTLRMKLRDNIGEDVGKSCMSCKETSSKLQEKDIQICELTEKVQELQVQPEKQETKSDKKSFSENIRLCVVELAGLEVAVEKVPQVIRTVSKHVFNKSFEKAELPTATTVQSIVDEGHFLAKTFLSQKLADSENWGLNRDGTTRRKQKILDTAITLDSGKTVSLGFNRVAHESAVTINNVTKSHLNELAEMNNVVDIETSSETYIKASLEKLAFTMSDRASNEKKACVLLSEWREEVIGKNAADASKVNSFHCMAHVLLGFHTYICKDMKDYEKNLTAEHGPLGRDQLSCFKFWSKNKNVLERAVKTTSDVFGPSGDHHGLRDRWEAHCAAHGIKSVIGNYKDNRFNGLFQTAAEICLHRADFIKVLLSVESPNLLVKSVLTDLQSEIIMSLLRTMGLFYINLTGPFWNLVVGSKVPYLELHREISAIHQYLKRIESNPEMLIKMCHWSEDNASEITDVPYKETLCASLSAVRMNEVSYKVLTDTITLTSRAIQRTVEKQLEDFLEGGKYSQQPEEQEVKRTSSANLTNLGCEHHFGSLDSSQRRRPSASLHHHSSVQLLKENRTDMMVWLSEMPQQQKDILLKSARKGGKALRMKHRNQDREVLQTISTEMLSKAKKTNKRKAETDISSKQKRLQCDAAASESESNYSDFEDEAELLDKLPDAGEIKNNSYVAVAYQDCWYPGFVKNTLNEDKAVVRFMVPTNKPGVFRWPVRDDVQTVERRFILLAGFVPDCLGSGRLWNIQQHSSIENIYKKFAKLYF